MGSVGILNYELDDSGAHIMLRAHIMLLADCIEKCNSSPIPHRPAPSPVAQSSSVVVSSM
jgi:hypothetical protein